jgi:RimJ/RimL family protein N-acetyltransferase
LVEPPTFPIHSEIDPLTGLRIGLRVADPAVALRPTRINLEGRYCRLEPVSAARHARDLALALVTPHIERSFLYLFDPLPRSAEETQRWLEKAETTDDPLVFAVIDAATGRCGGRQSLMRIMPEAKCIEIGNIFWGPQIARTRVATEAQFLLARYVFDDLGYRRYEWKCDALNMPSQAAARRFGFTYEGQFRRAAINKGRSRDTLWYSIIDEEWPAIRAAYECWLDPKNFDGSGQQRQHLSDLTRDALVRLRG